MINVDYNALLENEEEEYINISQDFADDVTVLKLHPPPSPEFKFTNKKRNRKNKNTQYNNCSVKEFLNMTNTGNIIVKEIPDNRFNLFLAKVKEVDFKTDRTLFTKLKENFNDDEDFLKDFNVPNINFWNQRYYYFSKFDEGIQMDYESWYSVTPEEISLYIAKSNKQAIVVDAFCGSGGNTIQFSKFCKKVFAVDIDPIKLSLCRNNAKVYNCPDNIEFINCDYLKLKESFSNIKSDIVFLSPPWGGMDYKSTDKYSLKQWITPDIKEIIRISLSISDNLVFFLPRNTDIEELFAIIAEVKSENLDRVINRSSEIHKEPGEIDETIINEENEDDDDNVLYAEVQMLNSANKVKAILVCIGEKYNNITLKEIRKYFLSVYPNIEPYQLCQLINFTKVIGVSRFFSYEHNWRKTQETVKKNKNKSDSKITLKIYNMIKHMKEEILTEEEMIEYNKLDKKKMIDKSKDINNQIKVMNLYELQSEENFKALTNNFV